METDTPEGKGWLYKGKKRPPFAIVPGPGQESVWDYPRPPVIAKDGRRVEVCHNGLLIASSNRSVRVLETASPPAFYLPPEHVRFDYLQPSRTRTFCEWKGIASYFNFVVGGTVVKDVAWTYADPKQGFFSIAGWLSFYPERVECFVDTEPVLPQGGGFYGGWMTTELVGPFKGEPGTGDW